MLDPLVRDTIAWRIKSTANGICFVAKYLGSKIPEQDTEAKRVKKNLEENIHALFNDPSDLQRDLKIPDSEYKGIDFCSYLTRVEECYKTGQDTQPVLQEMDKSIRYLLGSLY